MNSILATVNFLLLLSAVISAVPVEPETRKQNTLVALHVLFRHGNRTPDKSSLFPNDLYLNETYYPFGYSQLTLKGKQTEYEIGRYLRENYNKFIPTQYVPNVVYALSTNFKRTKMSLELVLAALFPPNPSEIISDNLNWQPIPFNIEPGQGLLGPASGYCANYINAYYQYILSEEAENVMADYQDLYQQLSKYAGFDVKTPQDVANIYFTFKSEEDFGLKLPDWAAYLYPEIIEEAASVYYEFATATSTLKKLSAGFLLRKILQDSFAAINGSLSDTKVFLYSAHEYNIGTVLRALNVFHRHVPPFGATIFFEIRLIDGVYGLKLFYQDYTAADLKPTRLKIPGCANFCPLDTLVDLIKDSIPDDTNVCTYTTELL